MSTYRELNGHDRTRVLKGHPARENRRLRAAERAARHVCGPTCKRNRQVAVK